MTDRWVSQGRHYCEICKSWCQNNKISIENHNKGVKHKEMIQKRLRDMEQKKKDEAKEKHQLQVTLLQMEAAANKSMGLPSPSASTSGPLGGIGPRVPAGGSGGGSGGGGSGMSSGPVITGPKSTYSTQRELKNTVKIDERILAKEKLKEDKKKLRDLKKTAKSQLWNDSETDEDQIQWVKAETEFGQTYYWNIYTGETRWNPPNRYFTTNEYNEKYSKIAQKYSFGEGTDPQAPGYPISDARYSAITGQEPYQVPRPQPTLAPSTKYVTSGYSPAAALAKASAPAPVPEEVPVQIEIPRAKKSRFDDPKTKTSKIKIEIMQPKVEPEEQTPHQKADKPEEDIKPDLISYKEVDPATAQVPQKRQRYDPFGPWVPVQKVEEKPKIVLDDLPEEAKKKVEEKELMEIDKSELTFEEKVAPVETKKKPKVIEFRKKKVNISVRSRMDD